MFCLPHSISSYGQNDRSTKPNIYLVTTNAALRIKCEKNGIIEFHIYFIRNGKLNERLELEINTKICNWKYVQRVHEAPKRNE